MLLNHYSVGLMIVGLYGMLFPRNFIGFLMAIEIVLLAITTHLVSLGIGPSLLGLIFFLITLGGAELALGLALVVQMMKHCPDKINFMPEVE